MTNRMSDKRLQWFNGIMRGDKKPQTTAYEHELWCALTAERAKVDRLEEWVKRLEELLNEYRNAWKEVKAEVEKLT